jgi:hypothetical protein
MGFLGIPTTIIAGSIAYLVLGFCMIGGVFGMRSIGKLNKDDAA